MADIIEQEQSEVIRITGGDESFVADVIQEQGFNKLLVKGSVELSSDLMIAQEYDQNQTLSDVTYFTIYSAADATVSGFTLQFNDKKVWVKLVVDGNTIFDINCEKLKELSDWNSFPQPQTYISWNDNLKAFYFTPSFPLTSAISIEISARSQTGQSKKYEGSIIQVG